MKAPATYYEWVPVFEELKRCSRNAEIIDILHRGTLSWQSGVAQRFSDKLVEAVNYRLNAANDTFSRNMAHASDERAIIQSLHTLRKEIEFLYQAVNIPAVPENYRIQYMDMIKKQADTFQSSLEKSAKSDRTGKLGYLIRNNKVNHFKA